MGFESAWQNLLDFAGSASDQERVLRGTKGLGIAYTALALSRTRPVVLVASSRVAADDLVRDLRVLTHGGDFAEILTLPVDDRTPFHTGSPDPTVVMERAQALFKIATQSPFSVLVLPPEALGRRFVPLAAWQDLAELVVTDEELQRDDVVMRLLHGGYSQVNLVEDPGTFGLRGGILDVFWPGLPHPVRIDLFGDVVDKLSAFDPDSQRTVETYEELTLGPAREVHLTDATVGRAKRQLRELADALEYPTRKLRELLGDLENRIAFFGIEATTPALYDGLSTPLELLNASATTRPLLLIEDEAALDQALEQQRAHYEDAYARARGRGALVFPPDAFLADEDTLQQERKAHPRVVREGLVAASGEVIELRMPDTRDLREKILQETMRRDDAAGHEHLLTPLADRIRTLRKQGLAVVLPVSSRGTAERLKELLQAARLSTRLLSERPDWFGDLRSLAQQESVHAHIWVSPISAPAHGGLLPAAGVAVIVEDEIFGRKARRQGKRSGKQRGFETSLTDLEIDDHVVHVEHGIGVFKGLTRLNVRGVEQDFLLLVYQGDDKLFLPVHRINQVQAYSGAGTKAPRLDKLGGTGWQSTKKKVKKAVLAMAQDLLALYARRSVAQRKAYRAPDEDYWQFEEDFPFEPTPDQQKAIEDVLADLQSPQPMDRLICGDVGYGKTEVGMRGAMLAVRDGRQVAVLAPTTVLAQQHAITFAERFRNTGAVVEVVSRFRASKDVKEVLKRTAEGQVDILIGTHRLLSNDVHFKNLGLMLVDEEQRFGVKAKEKLKKLRSSVDIMTLTATPIPRTLQMSFLGVRDLSVIESPPVDRRAIRTEVAPFDDEVIREAIMRELSRGGQVYFVHNRVRTIAGIADYIKRLVPEARVGVGHGQMDERTLEAEMLKFLKGEINVFVCTTIIETGIDVPSANTMFIDHADDFGVSQLYQLRGRVGRSKERAFAYLLIPGQEAHLTPLARKRLEVLQRFSDLGAGFQVAQHDLELRGAGDLLGKSQHGHITAVGYDIYTELLKEAVEELKGAGHDDVPDPDVTIPVAALIPEKYVVDLHERLSVYQKLATAKDGEDVYDVVGTMADRYGDPPAEVTALADVMILKQRLRSVGARAFEAVFAKTKGADENTPPHFVTTLGESARVNQDKLVAMVAERPERYKLTPQGKLYYQPDLSEWDANNRDILPAARQYLRRLVHAVARDAPAQAA